MEKPVSTSDSIVPNDQVDRKPIICDLCYLLFEKTELLEAHRNTQHGGTNSTAQTYNCKNCQETFKTDSALDEHVVTCQNEELFACNVCFRVFTDEKSCNKHSVQHMDIKPQRCNICGQVFNLEKEFKDHLCTTHDKTGIKDKANTAVENDRKDQENISVCGLCFQTFSQQELAVHMVTHHGSSNSEYTCDRCYKTFSKRKSLRRHRKHHCASVDSNVPSTMQLMDQIFGENAMVSFDEVNATDNLGVLDGVYPSAEEGETQQNIFTCEECQKTFNQESEYVVHMITHAVHKCRMCYKMFSSQHERDAHEDEIHKPFACKRCNRRFGRKVELLLHSRQHDMQKTFQCTHCNRLFYTQFHLDMHIFKSHGKKDEPNTCEKCHKKFTTKSDLNRHMSCHAIINPFMCPVCSMYFTSNAALTMHTQIHVDGKMRCSYCSKIFDKKHLLREHELTHYDEKQHKCSQCKEAFVTMHKLQQHEVKTGHFRTLPKKYESLISRDSCFCHKCKRVFQSEKEFLNHIKNDIRHKNDSLTVKSELSSAHSVVNRNMEVDHPSGRNGILLNDDDCRQDVKRLKVDVGQVKEDMSDKCPDMVDAWAETNTTFGSKRNGLLVQKKQVSTCERAHKVKKLVGEKLIRCNTCFLLFDSEDLLGTHVAKFPDSHRAPADEYKFICHECNMVFSGKKEFWQHISAHQQNDDSDCSLESGYNANDSSVAHSDMSHQAPQVLDPINQKLDNTSGCSAGSDNEQEIQSDKYPNDNTGNQNGHLMLDVGKIKQEPKSEGFNVAPDASGILMEKSIDSQYQQFLSEQHDGVLKQTNITPFKEQPGLCIKREYDPEHSVSYTEKIPFYCNQCSQYFMTTELLHEHMRIHRDVQPYQKNSNVAHLEKMHMTHNSSMQQNLGTKVKTKIKIKEEMPDIPLMLNLETKGNEEKEIPYAPFTLNSQPQRIGYKEKMEIGWADGPRKPFKCGKCDKTFTSEYFKNRHYTQYHSAMRCNKCGGKFANARELNMHILSVHTDTQCEEDSSHVKPHTCCYCAEQFTTKQAQLDHQLSHYDDKPYSCSECNERFVTKFKLKQHQMLHE